MGHANAFSVGQCNPACALCKGGPDSGGSSTRDCGEVNLRCAGAAKFMHTKNYTSLFLHIRVTVRAMLAALLLSWCDVYRRSEPRCSCVQ